MEKEKISNLKFIKGLLYLIIIIGIVWIGIYIYDTYDFQKKLNMLSNEVNIYKNILDLELLKDEDILVAEEQNPIDVLADKSIDNISKQVSFSTDENEEADTIKNINSTSKQDYASYIGHDNLGNIENQQSLHGDVFFENDKSQKLEQTSVYNEHPSIEDPAKLPLELEKYFEDLKEENEDFTGWIEIFNTVVDYPVMHTPENPEKYLHKNFDGKYSFAGLPFLDGRVKADDRGQNQIIYAHNMRSGQMFAILHKYYDEEFWKQNRSLRFYNMTEVRDYEIIALIPLLLKPMDHVSMLIFHPLNTQTAEAVQEINDYLAQYSHRLEGEIALDDDLLTLVTCRRARDSNRLLLVAKRVAPKYIEIPFSKDN